MIERFGFINRIEKVILATIKKLVCCRLECYSLQQIECKRKLAGLIHHFNIFVTIYEFLSKRQTCKAKKVIRIQILCYSGNPPLEKILKNVMKLVNFKVM